MSNDNSYLENCFSIHKMLFQCNKWWMKHKSLSVRVNIHYYIHFYLLEVGEFPFIIFINEYFN